MTNSILIQDITVEDLGKIIDNVIATRINDLKKDLEAAKAKADLLTRDETCEFLKIDSSTLWAWTNRGRVKAYGIGNRRYYKRSELLDALTPLKK